MIVYIDLIFLENLFMNLIIIYATSIILKKEKQIFKMLVGSVVGAIYACVYYITKLEIYSNMILKIVLSLVIIHISFGSKKIKEVFKEILIFYLTSFTLGGVTFALLYYISPGNVLFKNGALVGIYPLKIILIGGLLGFIIIICSFKSIKNKIAKKDMLCELKIIFNSKEIIINAIIDTGNFLKEPITGRPVVIVEKQSLVDIIPSNILNNIENILGGKKIIEDAYLPKITLIPFTALGTENGLLLGVKPELFFIKYHEKVIQNNNVIIGIYDKKLGKLNKYSALVGLDLIENINN